MSAADRADALAVALAEEPEALAALEALERVGAEGTALAVVRELDVALPESWVGAGAEAPGLEGADRRRLGNLGTRELALVARKLWTGAAEILAAHLEVLVADPGAGPLADLEVRRAGSAERLHRAGGVAANLARALWVERVRNGAGADYVRSWAAQRVGIVGERPVPSAAPTWAPGVEVRLVHSEGVTRDLPTSPALAADVAEALRRFSAGDWGEMCAEDRESTEGAVRAGRGYVMGVYPLTSAAPDAKNREVWVHWAWPGEQHRDAAMVTVHYPSEH